MKKVLFLACAVLCSCALTFTSCSDDETTSLPGVDQKEAKEYADYQYSDLTPEQQKVKLQDEANDFLKEMEGIQNEKAYVVLNAFAPLLNHSEEESNYPDPASQGVKAVIGLRSTDEIIYIKDYYGKFTWDENSEEWIESTSNSQREYNFPVNKTQKGSIVITGVASSTTVSLDETEKLQLPKQLTAKIKLDGVEVGSITVEANIKNENEAPKSAKIAYNMGDYSMTTEFAKQSPNVVVSSLKKGSTVLISATADMSGNLDAMLQEEEFTGGKGNVVIKIMDNLAITGYCDFEKYAAQAGEYPDWNFSFEKEYPSFEDFANYDDYMKACDAFEEEWAAAYDAYALAYEKAEENYYKQDAKAFNDNSEFYLVSRNDGTKIARLLADVKKETENGDNYTYSYWEEIYVFEFNDGTRVATDVYFSEGFDSFMSKWNDFVANFN